MRLLGEERGVLAGIGCGIVGVGVGGGGCGVPWRWELLCVLSQMGGAGAFPETGRGRCVPLSVQRGQHLYFT